MHVTTARKRIRNLYEDAKRVRPLTETRFTFAGQWGEGQVYDTELDAIFDDIDAADYFLAKQRGEKPAGRWSRNLSGVNLAGKRIRVRESVLLLGYRTPGWLYGLATGGFGCNPDTHGSAVFTTCDNGEHTRYERYDIEAYWISEEEAVQ